MGKQKVIAIVGPTASGKSALGAFLAQKLGGKIISADSRQVYTGMRIISRAERAAMVGIANPRRQYSAGTYAHDAKKLLAQLADKNKLPIVVGGTGFYADALLRGAVLLHVSPNKKLRAVLNKKTPAQLLAQLRKLDPASAKRVDSNNKVRLIRAIEIAKALGSVPQLSIAPEYTVLWLGLPVPKTYERVLRKGVEARLARGMVREAVALRKMLSKKRFLSLGFEFALLADYLDKKISRKELVEKIVRGEQKYAKRQMRWFGRSNDVYWSKNKKEALALAKNFLSS